MVVCVVAPERVPRFPVYLPQEKLDELEATAQALVICGKGILGTDETEQTLGVRFLSVGMENSLQSRQKYREVIYTTDCSIRKYISGIILHPEALNYQTEDGKSTIELITSRSIIPGIRVSGTYAKLPGTFDEYTTEGLDDLARRCNEYQRRGCRFAKWRGVFKISAPTPSRLAMVEVANTLAKYAVISQAAGLVPLIEPEVIADGIHSIQTAQRVYQEVFSCLFKALQDHHVLLEGLLLQTNFVRSGKTACNQSTIKENAVATLETLQRTIPAAVPGILFLSGGLTEDEATLNLNAINTMEGRKPWTLTFGYGRSVTNPVLFAWKGDDLNKAKAQCVLKRLARQCSQASMGFYKVLKKNIPGEIPEIVAQTAY